MPEPSWLIFISVLVWEKNFFVLLKKKQTKTPGLGVLLSGSALASHVRGSGLKPWHGKKNERRGEQSQLWWGTDGALALGRLRPEGPKWPGQHDKSIYK